MSAEKSRIAAWRYGGATKNSVSETATPSVARTTSTATTPVPRPGSGAKGCLLAVELGLDVLETGARGVALRRPERMSAEPRQLEQTRQSVDRALRQHQVPQRLAHELVRGLPRRAHDLGARGGALEAPVAPDDRAPRIRLAREIVEPFLHRLAQGRSRRAAALAALPPPGDALGEQQQQGDRERREPGQEQQQADEPAEPRHREHGDLGLGRSGI